MYTADIQIRVRYGETDQMGYVYYGHYASYYEVARVEALRKLGFRYKEMEEDGIMMPVLENHSKFIKPAPYDELLTVTLTIPDPPSVKIRFLYDIYDESRQLINKGETILAFVNKETGKPCRPPDHLQELLRPFFS